MDFIPSRSSTDSIPSGWSPAISSDGQEEFSASAGSCLIAQLGEDGGGHWDKVEHGEVEKED